MPTRILSHREVLTAEIETRLSDLQFGAEDGIRTRDPHLGKVVIFVRLGVAGP